MNKYLLQIVVLLCSCICVSAAPGIYLEFKITSASMNGTSKVYTANGNTRSEMTMTNSAMPVPFGVTTLILQSAPGKSYSLFEKDKTYTETDISKSHESDDDDYEVTVLGKEKVNNYNCVHVSVRYKKSKHTSEMWLSKDITGYADFINVKTKFLKGSGFFNALKEKGAEGFVVRMLTVGERGEKMQMDLVKAQKENVPESLFSLSGYTKSAGRTPGMGGPDAQQLQKMTPEERAKYIEEMKAKYKQQH